MKIYYDLNNFNNKAEPPRAVALGTFDGIHLGHISVIKNAVNYKASGLIPTVFTFSQNPSVVLKKDFPGKLVSNTKKIELIEGCGIENLFFINFEKIKELSAVEFAEDILIKKLNAKVIICGFNFYFGKNKTGDITTLKNIAEKHKVKVVVVEPVFINNELISSSKIREFIKIGSIDQANQMLGRFYSIKDVVISGNKLGRKLGFPTMNQQLNESTVFPKFGVYASFVIYKGVRHFSVTNIGIKPTIGSYSPLAETWVPEIVVNEMYNQILEVFLIDFIRPEKKFNNTDELKRQVLNDSISSKEIYSQKIKN